MNANGDLPMGARPFSLSLFFVSNFFCFPFLVLFVRERARTFFNTKRLENTVSTRYYRATGVAAHSFSCWLD